SARCRVRPPTWRASLRPSTTTSPSASASWALRSSSPSSGTHPRNELGRDRKLRGAEPHGFLRRREVDTVDLEQDASRLDLGDPVFRRALARTHADFGRLLRHRHVREYANPDAAGALHLARDGAARSFDLARVDALGLEGLQTIGAEVERRALLRGAVDEALELLSELGALGLQHGLLLRCGSRRRRRTALAAAAALGLCQALVLRHGVVFHDLALEDPDLDPAGAVGRLRGGDAIVDVGAQRVQRHAALVIPLDVRDLGAAETAAALDADAERAQAMGRLHGALHHATEGDAALELLGDVLGDQLGVDLGLADLDDVEMHLVGGVFLHVALQLLDVGALLADDHARARRVDGDAAFAVRTLD